VLLAATLEETSATPEILAPSAQVRFLSLAPLATTGKAAPAVVVDDARRSTQTPLAVDTVFGDPDVGQFRESMWDDPVAAQRPQP
jgi:hypothetical protein